jgi:hypothetical protein
MGGGVWAVHIRPKARITAGKTNRIVNLHNLFGSFSFDLVFNILNGVPSLKTNLQLLPVKSVNNT